MVGGCQCELVACKIEFAACFSSRVRPSLASASAAFCFSASLRPEKSASACSRRSLFLFTFKIWLTTSPLRPAAVRCSTRRRSSRFRDGLPVRPGAFMGQCLHPFAGHTHTDRPECARGRHGGHSAPCKKLKAAPRCPWPAMKLRRVMGVAPWVEGNTLAHHGTSTAQYATAKARDRVMPSRAFASWWQLLQFLRAHFSVQQTRGRRSDQV